MLEDCLLLPNGRLRVQNGIRVRETSSAGVHLESLDVKLQAALGPAHHRPCKYTKNGSCGRIAV